MKIIVKNLVSLRAKVLVKDALKNHDIKDMVVTFGCIEIFEDITLRKKNQIITALKAIGIEALDEELGTLAENIKILIIESIHYAEELPATAYPQYISEQLGYDYPYLSALFSQVNGISIEQCIVTHKIERIKELIIYDQLRLAQIAARLHYRSVAQMSVAFKKVTGLSPSYFATLKVRKPVAG